ncbi:MAG: ABC transporter substrate-binding protein [Heliobacteriaceae bacterium]|nr:ABC transporter substrate-binding protein [Heliobacteriaceae bacterium]MDD4588715.1 ABC transporter substrate-binding protein [Heliobacteriaceae bacterium]
MKNFKLGLTLMTAFMLLLSLITLAGCSQEKAVDTTPANRTVVDMAGREVTLPAEIQRIAAVGPVPVINTFIFTVGEKDKIVNGLPGFADNERWKYQKVFAPHLANQPRIQESRTDPNIEELIKLEPDVVFTMDKQMATTVANANLNAVFLSWTEPEDVKQTISLVGKVLNKKDLADEYIKYFDATLAKIGQVVAAIPEAKKPRVLYANMATMTAPHEISDWWIETAGGKSVAKADRAGQQLQFSVEQLLKWDPEIIIVSTPQEVQLVNEDPRFQKITAVVNKKVYPTPMGAHVWAHRTAEQPLSLMWAAKTFHPEIFNNLDLEQEMTRHYQQFYGYTVDKTGIKEILAGGAVLTAKK